MHHATELAKRFKVTLVSDGFPAERIEGVTLSLLQPLRFGLLRRFSHVPNEVAFALAARTSVSRLHRTMSIDWIVSHSHLIATLVARPLRKRLGIPYALVTHGDIFDRPEGTYDPRLTKLYRCATPAAYRDADLVIALSPHMGSLAVLGGAIPERVVVIPNGIDPVEIGLSEIEPPLPPKTPDRLEILFVGRLSVEKGVDRLLEAASLLLMRGVTFRLRITGEGPEGKRLKSQAERLALGTLVEFQGPIYRPQLGAQYRSADVVCVPSRSDPLPTVVLEAMVSGVGVVGTDVGGIPFMVENATTGFLVPADDAAALADALERFVFDDSLARRMGEAGQLRARNVFNWTAIANTVSGELVKFQKKQQVSS